MNQLVVATAIALMVLFGVSCSDDHAPTAPEPPPETFGQQIEGKELEWYTRITDTARKDVEFYHSVLGYDETLAWLTGKVRRLEDGSYSTAWLPDLTAPLPSFEESLTDAELEKLGSLEARLYQAFVEQWELGASIHAPEAEPLDREVYVSNRVDEEFRRLRKALDGLPTEIPPIEKLVHAEGLKVYNSLDPFWQGQFMDVIARAYIDGQASGGLFPSLEDWETKNTFNRLALQFGR